MAGSMMDDHDDFAFEPVPGLPERLPAGESLLWQGSPDWRALAVSAFHVRKVAAYFGIVLVWQVVAAAGEKPAAMMAISALWLLVAAAAAIGILCLLAYLYARGTIYSLTTKRIVIRSGLALPVTLNLPLALVETAAVTRTKGRTGSIALTVVKPNRIAFLALWPNARPFTFNDPQPMLRCLKDVDAVAPLLATTLVTEAGGTGMRLRTPAPDVGSAAPAGRPVAA